MGRLIAFAIGYVACTLALIAAIYGFIAWVVVKVLKFNGVL